MADADSPEIRVYLSDGSADAVGRFAGHSSPVMALAFNEQANTVVSGDRYKHKSGLRMPSILHFRATIHGTVQYTRLSCTLSSTLPGTTSCTHLVYLSKVSVSLLNVLAPFLLSVGECHSL